MRLSKIQRDILTIFESIPERIEKGAQVPPDMSKHGLTADAVCSALEGDWWGSSSLGYDNSVRRSLETLCKNGLMQKTNDKTQQGYLRNTRGAFGGVRRIVRYRPIKWDMRDEHWETLSDTRERLLDKLCG